MSEYVVVDLRNVQHQDLLSFMYNFLLFSLCKQIEGLEARLDVTDSFYKFPFPARKAELSYFLPLSNFVYRVNLTLGNFSFNYEIIS